MKRTTLIAIAAATLSFTAAPAFAQSSYDGKTGAESGNQAETKAEAKRIRAAQMVEQEKARMRAEEADIKAVPAPSATGAKMMTDKASKGHSSATDGTMMKEKAMTEHSSATHAAMMKEKAVKEKTMTDQSSASGAMMKDDATLTATEKDMMKTDSRKPTNCPSGTTPQDNGTCLLN